VTETTAFPGAVPTPDRFFRRNDRVLLRFEGRAPGRMLTGLVTGAMGQDPQPIVGTPWQVGAIFESLVLTPKGRIVTDLRLLRVEGGEAGAYVADLPIAGEPPLRAHLARYLPPRFAKASPLGSEMGMVTLVGPRAFELLAGWLPEASEEVLGALTSSSQIDGGMAGASALIGGFDAGSILVFSDPAVGGPALDVIAPMVLLDAWMVDLAAAGLEEGNAALWQAFRVRHGFPETGSELDEGVLPPEAGLERRAIDHRKGCYTGQEVIVRIRDRGHVNRHLRQLVLPAGPLPAPDTPLYREDDGKEIGIVKTSVADPDGPAGFALAYIRREVESGARVRIGDPGGIVAEVRIPPFQERVGIGAS